MTHRSLICSALMGFSALSMLACAPAAEPPVSQVDEQLQDAAATLDTNETQDAFDPGPIWQNIRADFDLFYAYRDLRGFDADAYLDRAQTYVTAAPSFDVFRQRLNRMTYAFTDPHLGFGPYTDTDFNVIPTSSDLRLGEQDGAFIVLDVRAGSAAEEAGVRSGWILTHVNDQPIDGQVQAVFDPLIETPSARQRAYAATLVANGRRGDTERRLRFQSPGADMIDVTLANPRELARAVNDFPPIETRSITGPSGQSFVLIRINNRLGDNDLIKDFDDVMKRVAAADGLILDLRNTPSGGNTEVGRSLMGHFVSEPRPYQMHEVPSLEREFTVPRRFVEYVLPRAPYFDPEKTVVLGGYWTGSMGEGIVIGMDAIGATSVASDMGDLLGGMSNFTFDNEAIQLSIPTETLFHVDGTPREDFIAAHPIRSADTDAMGDDPGLATAISILARD
jgi:carboxyl-terminal processing protease